VYGITINDGIENGISVKHLHKFKIKKKALDDPLLMK
jgi:hypothetical protein